ncbi:hypothetical protein [Aestuariivirga sp.]|uniref:hypothetical protein n=1 Tax=Aestuariivirga sp. TaxID=2650926 RepID=UPI0039E67E52
MSSDDAELILASWSRVGKDKAVGYLPLRTVEKILNLDRRWIESYCTERGLQFKVFGQDETCIQSGAVYIWSEQQLNLLLGKHHLHRDAHLSTNEFISLIAKRWFTENDDMMSLIRAAFADED